MYSLVIHGGAGDLSKKAIKELTEKTGITDLEKRYETALKECVN